MAERERTFLGLTHNPFVEPHKGFFERGGRKTHLEQLRHLSEWSRRVLLVTGSDGVGKTTLYRELAATLEPRVKAARINAGLVNTGFEVLSAIAQGFGLALPGDANTQSLRMDLIDHVEKQAAGDRLCLTLVDDAHLLDHKAVESLIALTHESPMHLVLFGEVRMVPMIERAASAKGVGWQEIRLNGYGEADAREYLEWRFSQAKYRGRVPFTDSQVKDLIRLSQGLPGRINQMANVLLVKLETGEGVDEKRAFPRLHTALLALLVAVVGLLYLLADESPAPEDVSVAVQTERVDDAESADPAMSPSAAMEDTAGAADDGSAAELTQERIWLDEEPVDADPVQAAAEEVTAPEPVTPPVQEVAVQSVPEPEPEPEPEPDPVVVAAVPAVEAPAGARDTSWLLKQNPEYFTLQLVTVSSPESATNFIARQREPDEFTVYQLQRDGRILHVVLYGLFSSRSAAEAAADDLPAEVGRVQPWIRPVEQVQAAARLSTVN